MQDENGTTFAGEVPILLNLPLMSSSSSPSWLRHPLLDLEEINHRLDIVEILTKSVLGRNRLVDGSLKGIPDVDLLLSKSVSPSLTSSHLPSPPQDPETEL
jgi:hypothetical protein